jgi:hypothetical protein
MKERQQTRHKMKRRQHDQQPCAAFRYRFNEPRTKNPARKGFMKKLFASRLTIQAQRNSRSHINPGTTPLNTIRRLRGSGTHFMKMTHRITPHRPLLL